MKIFEVNLPEIEIPVHLYGIIRLAQYYTFRRIFEKPTVISENTLQTMLPGI